MSKFGTRRIRPAPARYRAALLKSADPMVAATRGATSRAQTLQKGAIRRISDTLAESRCCSSFRPEVAAFNGGTAAVGLARADTQSFNAIPNLNEVSYPSHPMCAPVAYEHPQRQAWTKGGVTNPTVLQGHDIPQLGLDGLFVVVDGNFSPPCLPAHRQFGSAGPQTDFTRHAKSSPIMIEEAVRSALIPASLTFLLGLVLWWFCSANVFHTASGNTGIDQYSEVLVLSAIASSSAAAPWPRILWRVAQNLANMCVVSTTTGVLPRRTPLRSKKRIAFYNHSRPILDRNSPLLELVARDYARSAATGNTGSRARAPATDAASSRPSPQDRSGGRRNRSNSRTDRGRSNDAHARKGATTSQNTANANKSVVKLMYWNIYHDFTLKLMSTEFRSILQEYDIMLFAETDMLPGEEDAADVPAGYTMLSLPRKPLLNNSRRGGGIALIIRNTFKFKKSSLSSPDILVLDMGTMWVIGAYIPPQSSRWQGWTDVEPIQKLRETMAICAQNEDKPIALLGDINARIGELQTALTLRGADWERLWKRISSDPVIGLPN
ncbi:hypothetical protein C8J57DRAFT_1535215 [Mycena rebaudengoi]|nr:hypothetical protein C8J57DRAFT_1535215 [Mycena rebaudengoi]